jgi:replicative DNA helicase
MLAPSDRGQPIDHITVIDVLRSRGELEPVGGSAGVGELLTVEASPGNCVAYTQVVREHALRRTVIERAVDVCDLAFASRPLEEIAQRLRAAIPEAHQSAEARGVAQRRLASFLMNLTH